MWYKLIVYIDVLILYNTAINALLLHLSAHFNKLHVKYKAIYISAFIGAVAAGILIMYVPLKHTYIFKVILPCVMCGICSKHQTVKQYINLTITYLIFAFLLSGITLGFFIKKDFKISAVVTISAVLILITIYKKMINFFINHTKHFSDYIEVIICHQNTTIKMTGFNDSGNNLISSKNGLPVYITDEDSLEPIIKKGNIKYDYLNCCTINGKSNIKCFNPEYICVNGKKVEALVGISNIALNTDYDILLNLSNTIFSETETNYV